MPALRNPVHESMCRDVAGGMSREAAWRAHGFGSRNSTRFFKRPKVAARVAELQAEFNEGSKISLTYLQERLLAFTTADIGNYLEKRPYSDKLRVKDLTQLRPELRACVSEVTIDKSGTLNFKLHDKVKAVEALIKTVAPAKFEVTGANGASLFNPDNLAKLDEDEILILKRLVTKILGAQEVLNEHQRTIEHQTPDHVSAA